MEHRVYIAAYVPANGQAIGDLASTDAQPPSLVCGKISYEVKNTEKPLLT
jgi:hypothetical protein